MRITPERPYSPVRAHPHTVTPRKSVPVPTTFEPPQFDVSPIPADVLDDEDVPGTRDDIPQSEVRDYYSPKKSPQKRIPEDREEYVSNIVHISNTALTLGQNMFGPITNEICSTMKSVHIR